jgi:hypothetical protein
MVGFVEVGTRVHSGDLGKWATFAAASAINMYGNTITKHLSFLDFDHYIHYSKLQTIITFS